MAGCRRQGGTSASLHTQYTQTHTRKVDVIIHDVLLFLSTVGLSQSKQHLNLKMDEAFLTVINELDTEVAVSWVSQRCYQV